LDEYACGSVDVETLMYNCAKELGITLFISHRQSLFKHHEWPVRFDSEGGYNFGKMEIPTHSRLVVGKTNKVKNKSNPLLHP
jgi:hypothetical protein